MFSFASKHHVFFSYHCKASISIIAALSPECHDMRAGFEQ
jgi:hypothetical protein